ncbi:MAG: putative dehydrogenase [Kiritimatiellia bacterium]|jgi:predicted dehydrogenase
MSSLRIAIIGLGRWGPNHVRNFSSIPDCEVVAVVDPDENARLRIGRLHPTLALHASLESLLAEDLCDALVVATPTDTHFDIVKAGLNAGKHVLCEKPLTNQSKTAWELQHLAEENGVMLMVGHVFLFNSGINYLCNAVQEQNVGQIYCLNATRTNLGPFRADVNAAWDLASHDIYIFNELLGCRPESVSAVGQSYLRQPVEDIVYITLLYPNRVMGHIHVSWLDPKKVRQITLVGENKMITWDELANLGPITIHDRSVQKEPVYETFGEFQLLTREGDLIMPRIPASEPLGAQARSFVSRCQARIAGEVSLEPRGSARQGAEVVDVLEAVDRSLAQKGAAVEVQYGG